MAPVGPTGPPGSRVDGRTARSERTRKAIVDAHVALILAGELRPTAERIADHAGVSLRALWGHFADMETLFAASAERILLAQDAAYRPVEEALPLPERIAGYCAQRARLLEQLAPAARAGQLKEPFSPALLAYRSRYVDRARAELTGLFAPELAAVGADREDVLAALITVSLWPTWATLRDDLALDVDAARAVLTRTVAALLS
jgi:AcrR family transcriptional regulator